MIKNHDIWYRSGNVTEIGTKGEQEWISRNGRWGK